MIATRNHHAAQRKVMGIVPTRIIAIFGLCSREPIYGSREQVVVEGDDGPVIFYKTFLLLHREKIEDLREEVSRLETVDEKLATQLNQLLAAVAQL